MADDLRRDFLNCYLIQATLLLRSHGPRRSTGIESVVNSRPNLQKEIGLLPRGLLLMTEANKFGAQPVSRSIARGVCANSQTGRSNRSIVVGRSQQTAYSGASSNSRRPFQCFHINRPVVARCPDQELA